MAIIRLVAAMLACASTAAGSALGDPTFVLGPPPPAVGVFDIGIVTSVGDLTFQAGDPIQPDTGHYLYHTCDPTVAGGYYGAYVDTVKDLDGTVVFENRSICERGSFQYANDGVTLQWTYALAELSFVVSCAQLGDAFGDATTTSRLGTLPDAAPIGEFCGESY